MAQEPDGLFGVLNDLAAGKSIGLPSPYELQQTILLHRAQGTAPRWASRSAIGEAIHSSVVASFEDGPADSILERLGLRW